MESYDYSTRKGTRKISWEDFGAMSRRLVELLSKENIDIVIGIARAGLFPATAVSLMLQKEMYPVRLTRRLRDKVITKKPVWKTPLPDTILHGKVVAIIDEIADSGETLSLAKNEATRNDARKVVTASLFSHTWANPKPDFFVLKTDELLLLPWDYRIYKDGEWIIHPEYKTAIDLQNKE